jgi:hypothetical protein
MALSELETRNYFSPPDSSFWRWQDDGQVVCWADGRTIAFREELLAVLERLAAEGLPPLGAVLLVLAACRENWPSEPSRRGILLGLLSPADGIVTSEDLKLLTEVCRGLDNVHDLAAEQRGTPTAKSELCDLVFHGKDERYLDSQSMQLIVGFQIGLTPEQLEPINAAAMDLLRRDLRALQSGLSRVDADRLARRTRTGLDQTLAPVGIDVPPAEAARRLISQLQNHPELSGVARLARKLLSVIQWPRPLADLSEIPAGGFSDIANRGTLDRLLLSELANDDMTLAVRVASGEAMYLRREVPPAIPPRERIVLMDVGLRMWGVPRVFGTAVGMALAAASQAEFNVSAYRADGPDIIEADLASESGLTEQLAALDYRAHPGLALPQWEALIAGNASATDTVLVTGEDVLDDFDFQQALARLSLDEFYLATVSREGRFRLLRHSHAGKKIVREAQFSLDEVLARDPVAKPLIDPKDGGKLPAFLQQFPLPLLLSRPFDLDSAWLIRGEGLLALTKDNRLVLWTRPDLGSQEIAAGMPPGKIHCCSAVIDDVVWAVIGRLGPKSLYSVAIDLKNMRVKSQVRLQIIGDTPRGAFLDSGFVYVVSNECLDVLDPRSGEHLLAINTRISPRWSGYGRYFRPPDRYQWFAAAYGAPFGETGGSGFQEVISSDQIRSRVVAVFDAADVEGPVAIHWTGKIQFADGSEKAIQIHNRQGVLLVEVLAISRDGHRFAIETNETKDDQERKRFLVYTLTGATRPLAQHQDPKMAVDWIFNDVARPQQLRYRFRGIFVDNRRRLTLLSRHGAMWPLGLQDNNQRYAFPKQGTHGGAPHLQPTWRTFDSVESWNGTEYEGLSLATWPSGDRAILDSRGLLHLQAADGRVAEFTILLAEGETAGWSVDGRWWGPKYFRGDHTATPVADIVREVINPFIEGLL